MLKYEEAWRERTTLLKLEANLLHCGQLISNTFV